MSPRSDAGGVVIRVAIVGCGKSKAPRTCEARDLYTGSLFRAARRFAETCDAWWIVSARYGLVAPEARLAPYEYRLGPKDRQQWGMVVANRIVTLLMPKGPYELIILAGADYAEPIVAGMLKGADDEWRCNCVGVTTPLAGLGLGARMSWLARSAA